MTSGKRDCPMEACIHGIFPVGNTTQVEIAKLEHSLQKCYLKILSFFNKGAAKNTKRFQHIHKTT